MFIIHFFVKKDFLQADFRSTFFTRKQWQTVVKKHSVTNNLQSFVVLLTDLLLQNNKIFRFKPNKNSSFC